MSYQINSEKILFTQLGDEGVIYAMDTNEYVSLNETFFKILKCIEEGKSEPEIVAALCKEYNISENECKQEVVEALQHLEAKEFLIQ